MTRLEKLMEGIEKVLPGIEESDVKRLFGTYETCLFGDYCDDYFYLKANGEYLLDEDGEKLINPDMHCEDIVNKWLSEEYR